MKRLFALVILVLTATLGGVAGCGGEERLSRGEFGDRLQSIENRGGELWERLAERAQNLETDQPLPRNIEQALEELVEFQEQTVAELETLTPPEDAQEPVETLTEALRTRTESFKKVIAAGHFTEQDAARVTQAGDEIDEAFEQLRAGGFLPTADDHQE